MGDRGRAFEFCASCVLTAVAVGAAVVGSFMYLSLGLDRLLSVEAVVEMAGFFASFFPPDLSPEYLAKTARGALETLAIALVGTLLAAVLALPIGLLASGRGGGLRHAARFMLNLLRSVPELVWATIMVLAAGLGPFAGTLALALHTAGVLGRLFAEALENVPETPARALADTGAGPVATFLYATLPSAWPQLLAYTLYRWEMNIRMAAVLGFVGAGGLGQMLYYSLSLFHQAQAATVIIAMLALSVLVDAASANLRARFVDAQG